MIKTTSNLSQVLNFEKIIWIIIIDSKLHIEPLASILTVFLFLAVPLRAWPSDCGGNLEMEVITLLEFYSLSLFWLDLVFAFAFIFINALSIGIKLYRTLSIGIELYRTRPTFHKSNHRVCLCYVVIRQKYWYLGWADLFSLVELIHCMLDDW